MSFLWWKIKAQFMALCWGLGWILQHDPDGMRLAWYQKESPSEYLFNAYRL